MATFAWPISALILGLVIFLSFRFPNQVGGLIDRIKKIGVSGVDADGSKTIVIQEAKDIVRAEAAEEQLAAFDNQLLVMHENNIRQTTLQNVPDHAARERILIRHLASLFLTYSLKAITTLFGVPRFTHCA